MIYHISDDLYSKTQPGYLLYEPEQVWGASTQGGRSHLPPGSPNCVNAIGRANMTLVDLLEAFFK